MHISFEGSVKVANKPKTELKDMTAYFFLNCLNKGYVRGKMICPFWENTSSLLYILKLLKLKFPFN
jgi:hypothetical protein